jgi:glycosyltransferase involved in cell wall biosynthesis
MTQRRVLFVFLEVFGLKGGIQVFSQDLLRAVGELFPDRPIDLILVQDTALPKGYPLPPGVNPIFCGHPNPWVRRLRSTWAFYQQLLRAPGFILCGHVNVSGLAALWPIPFAILAYGVDVWIPLSALRRRGLHRAKQILSISRFTSAQLCARQGVLAQQIALFPCSYDEERFQPLPRSAPQLERLRERHQLQGKKVIFTVCRLAADEQYKGYDAVIKALPAVLSEIPNAVYLLGGKGEDKARIEELIASLGLGEQVQMVGFIPDAELADYYNVADVFIMPSLGEGFGIVFLEAMACNTPAIGGNRDGSVDPLADGELGTLVDPTDVQDIARGLIEVLRQPRPNDLHAQIRARFGYERFREQVRAIFTELLA